MHRPFQDCDVAKYIKWRIFGQILQTAFDLPSTKCFTIILNCLATQGKVLKEKTFIDFNFNSVKIDYILTNWAENLQLATVMEQFHYWKPDQLIPSLLEGSCFS